MTGHSRQSWFCGACWAAGDQKVCSYRYGAVKIYDENRGRYGSLVVEVNHAPTTRPGSTLCALALDTRSEPQDSMLSCAGREVLFQPLPGISGDNVFDCAGERMTFTKPRGSGCDLHSLRLGTGLWKAKVVKK